jgi:hypothetical protein
LNCLWRATAADERARTIGLKAARNIGNAVLGDSQGADGEGIVIGQWLYQLIRRSGKILGRTFEMIQARAFTFG